LFVVFRNILFLWVFFSNVLTCYKPFEEFLFLLFFYGYPEWIWRLRHARVKTWNTSTSEHFRVSNLINHVTLRIKVKMKYSEWIWRFEAREGKKVKYVFANTTTQREKKVNHHANTPAAVKMNKINPKYENTQKIHRLLTIWNPGFLYKE